MSDETMVEPALSAEEWALRLKGDHNVYEDGIAPNGVGVITHQGLAVTYDTGFLLDIEAKYVRALIAVANAALPDDDPRKITWGMVSDLRQAAARLVRTGDHRGVDLAGHADALASYLQPE